MIIAKKGKYTLEHKTFLDESKKPHLKDLVISALSSSGNSRYVIAYIEEDGIKSIGMRVFESIESCEDLAAFKTLAEIGYEIVLTTEEE